jgi:uncharacterized membrane protein YeaQ/YmgE (transglycosylase-associated protein family)
MKKLTSAATFFGKKVFPIIFGGVAGLFALLISSQVNAIPIFLVIPIGLVTGFIATMFTRHLHSGYMDEVFDAGDRLVIRNRGIEESIDLRDIRVVDSTIMRPAGVWLHLRRNSVFGRSIKFLPATSSLFEFSKLAKSLNTRIRDAEQDMPPGA